MEQRAILAVAISLAILLIYNEFILPTLYPQLDTPPAPMAEVDESKPVVDDAPLIPSTVASHSERESAPAAVAENRRPERELTIETDFYTAVLTSRGGRLKSFQLKDHRETVEPDSPGLELIHSWTDDLPLGVDLRKPDPNNQGRAIALSDASGDYSLPAEGAIRVAPGERREIEMRWQGAAGTVTKSLVFQGGEREIFASLQVTDAPAEYTDVALNWTAVGGDYYTGALIDRAVYLEGRSLEQLYLEDSYLADGLLVSKAAGTEDEDTWKWAGFAGQHFFIAMVPDPAGTQPTLFLKQPANSQVFRERFIYTLRGGAIDEGLTLYLGPKDMEILEGIGHTLSRAVDLGWFSFVALPMLWLLRQCHRFTGNYGADIILLTVLIKIVFLPLTRKSFVQMKGMQKLQPEMEKIREQHKDSPENLQKEMMELYRRHGVNPLGGCLPMVVQIPVFIGLYQALMNAVELRHAPFIGWINDLSAPDRLGDLAIPFVSPPGIPVLTIVMGASMFLQQWMTPMAGDPMQRRMMMLLPLMFTFMFLSFPAGLVLYWTVNNVLTIAQQAYIQRSAD